MADSVIYIPFPKGLYDDMVRFSDGSIDVANHVQVEMETWMHHSVADDLWDWGDRWHEVAKIYAPDVAARHRENMEANLSARFADRRPLIWKEVSVPSGTLVRMHYQGTDHLAEVKNAKIVDNDGEFTPSEWASKVANNTNRNAWRDLWFKEPSAKGWSAASEMRKAARKAQAAGIDDNA